MRVSSRSVRGRHGTLVCFQKVVDVGTGPQPESETETWATLGTLPQAWACLAWSRERVPLAGGRGQSGLRAEVGTHQRC